MKRFAAIAVLIALWPHFAFAQYQGPPTNRNDHEKKVDAAIDKDYRDTVKREKLGTPPPPSDPWGSVRPLSTDATKKN
jgi:hypothetical protein